MNNHYITQLEEIRDKIDFLVDKRDFYLHAYNIAYTLGFHNQVKYFRTKIKKIQEDFIILADQAELFHLLASNDIPVRIKDGSIIY